MATWQEEGWMDGSEEVMLCFHCCRWVHCWSTQWCSLYFEVLASGSSRL